MDVVFSQFLPLDWSAEREGVVDGPACVSALKLVCALVSASRNITASLVSKQHLKVCGWCTCNCTCNHIPGVVPGNFPGVVPGNFPGVVLGISLQCCL